MMLTFASLFFCYVLCCFCVSNFDQIFTINDEAVIRGYLAACDHVARDHLAPMRITSLVDSLRWSGSFYEVFE